MPTKAAATDALALLKVCMRDSTVTDKTTCRTKANADMALGQILGGDVYANKRSFCRKPTPPL